MAADPLSRVFSALADPTRRDMVARLALADATVNELAQPYDVTVQAVSKHLKVLEDAGLVSRSREAQRRPVHLEAEVFDLMTKWIERYRRQAEERYRRLDAVLRPCRTTRPPPHRSEKEHRHDQHHRHETQIVADPDVPLVRIVREFDAPRAKVFRAHTDPELVVQWLGPRDLTMRIDHFDCRTGGSTATSTPGTATSTGSTAASTRCGRTELIVQTFTYEGFPDGVALERLTFEDLGDGRTRLTATSLVDSFEGRDAFVASGMETGVIEGYERLDELLAR